MTAARSLDEVVRAARTLAIRSRREASDVWSGAYASAFRGGGIEFEESRPYVPGDDVRALDWNATARTGEPHVKRFREERDRTVLVLLDVSASMAFGSADLSKAGAGLRAAALLAAAAGGAGDRVGLVVFDSAIRAELRPARGPRAVEAVVRAAAEAAAHPGRGTRTALALERARRLAHRRAILLLVSDMRDEALFGSAELAAAARRHDLAVVAISDPREAELAAAGGLRIGDPELDTGTYLLRSGSARARAVYAAAAATRRRAVEHRLRAARADLVWLSTQEDPLRVLGRFFRERAGRARPAA